MVRIPRPDFEFVVKGHHVARSEEDGLLAVDLIPKVFVVAFSSTSAAEESSGS